MREWDRREIFATHWEDDPVQMATATVSLSASFAWVFGKDEPIAAVGAYPVWPGVWAVWAFGTERFPEVALSLTRFIRRIMIPSMKRAGMHRAECKSLDGHADAQRWLECLGFTREATHRQYGRAGETFHTYALLE